MANIGQGYVPHALPGHFGDVQAWSNKELVRGFVENSETLIKQQIALAKYELRDELKQAAKGSGLAAGGGVVGHVAFIVLAFCAVYALGLAVPLWLSALIVGAALAICAAVLVMVGKKKLQSLSEGPRETVGQLEEDRRWAQETMRGIKSNRHANA